MSKLYDLREALKAQIVAANLGWTDDTVLIKRQGSFWNQVATAIGAAKNGAVLHIGIATGKPIGDETLEMELSIPLTIVCKPQVSKDAVPEEDLWEALLLFVHDLKLSEDDHCSYRMIFDGFTDLDIEAAGGTSYLGRMTTFKRRLTL